MINLYDILKAANGQLFGEPAANLFKDFCLDPRKAESGLLFVAMRTNRGDTHSYITEAVQNGASGVLCVDPPDCDTTGVSVLMVRDTLDALMSWAQYTLGKLNVRTIVVSGSSTKGVTVDAIANVLGSRHRVHRGSVDLSGRLAIPMSLAKLTPDVDYAVIRLNSTYPGEMAQMVSAINPYIVVIVNIDCIHPAAFENCDQYVKEHSVLLEYLSPGAVVVLNNDDQNVRGLAQSARDGVIIKTVGIDSFGADVMAFNVKLSTQRAGFDLRFEGERFLARWSPILGRHHLYGLLASLVVGYHCDLSVEATSKSLSNLAPLPGRLSPLSGINDSIVIDDTFAASYHSTMAALEWLSEVRDSEHRAIFIIGDMDDLGPSSRFGHRSVGQRAAEVADIIITQGVEAALVGRAAIDNGMDPSFVRMTYSAQDVVAALETFELSEFDIILIKGGEAARMEQVVRALVSTEVSETYLSRQDDGSLAAQSDIPTLRPSWVQVDAGIIANNTRIIKSLVGDNVVVMAVVKADGYGHGSVVAARTALMNGAGYLGVASMAEAMALRDAGIDAPILVFSYAPAASVRQALREGITLTIFDNDQARAYDRAARSLGGKLKCHIKIDTGMGRLGIFPDNAIQLFRQLSALNYIEIEGIYTHFAVADVDPNYTADQLDLFQDVIRPLRATGLSIRYIHAANSAAVLLNKASHFNMVRPGLILYGMNPIDEAPFPDGIHPALSWKTTIVQVKVFPPGFSIGYGNTYRTRGEERIAVIPVGYADGFRRAPQTWQYVLVHGQRAPVVGRVSMEKTTINVTSIPSTGPGDEVVLLGRQGDEEITAEMIADWLGTSNYEVATSILARLPRG